MRSDRGSAIGAKLALPSSAPLSDELLPTFFVIGAAKCGTTSLHFYLDQHPEISMSDLKEPHVFADSRSLAMRSDYRGLFKSGPSVRGESSTGYSRCPAEGDAAAAISAAIPDAKLIYLVGDPVERIISDYAQQVAVGVEPLSLEEALNDFDDPGNFYVCASRYAMQVENYLGYFEPSQLLVLEQWRLRHERRAVLREVFSFLGVERHFWSSGFGPEIATREDHVRYDGLLWRLRSSRLGAAYRRLPVGPRLRLSRTLRRRAGGALRPKLDPERRGALTEILIPEVGRLRQLTGRPLEHLPGAPPA
jgi:Sulfotransferase domain